MAQSVCSAAGTGWYADELWADPRRWRLTVPPEVSAELLSRAEPEAELDVDDPPIDDLPLTAAFASAVMRRLSDADGDGVVLLSGMPVGDERQARAALWVFGRVLGRPVPQSLDGALVGRVEDAGAQFGNPEHRGHRTRAALPFHVDRTDVVGLLCVRAGSAGGVSQVASSATVHDVLLAERPDLLDELHRPFPQDRRGEQPAGAAPWSPLPVCAEVDGRLIVRYLRRFIESSQRHASAPRLTDRQRAALDAVDEILARPEVVLAMDLAPGDLQLIDNHSILHARSAFAAAPGGLGRLLLRLWLSTAGSPRLPEPFAPLYGSVAGGTVRGGVWPPDRADLVGVPVGPIRPTRTERSR